MSEIVFYILSIMAIFSALMVVFSRNAMYSVLYLVVTFVSITLHYLMLLNASFLGIVNIIVYAGAIMVLFLYVIMLLNLNERVDANKHMLTKVAAVATGFVLLVVIIGALRDATSIQTIYQLGDAELGELAKTQDLANLGTVKNLGKVLFTKFVLPFELASVLFLAAMVGAVLLGKKQPN